MANFNNLGQSGEESNSSSESNHLGDTVEFQSITDEASENEAESEATSNEPDNGFYHPENHYENDDKPEKGRSLKKKLAIGGAAVALAVALGAHIYTGNHNSNATDTESISASDPIEGSENKETVSSDTIEVNNLDGSSSNNNESDIIGDGAYIINYADKVTIPDIDNYQSNKSITTNFLEHRSDEAGWSSLEQCFKVDPLTVGSFLARGMQSNGYGRVEAITAHDGIASDIYPAALSSANDNSGQVCCIYKGNDKFSVLFTRKGDGSDQRYHLQFDANYMPTYDELVKIWQNNPDLIKADTDDNYISSNDSVPSNEYGVENNPSAYDDGPQA